MGAGVVVIGASGFGRETLDVLQAQGRAISGVLDDSPSQINLDRLGGRGIPYLGTVDDWLREASSTYEYVVGIGSGLVKELISAKMDAAGHCATTAVHPAAVLGSQVTLGPGVVVCAGATLTTNITLHEHVHVNPNVAIGHDTTVGAFSSANPAAVVAGEVRVGRRVLLGAGSHVLQNLSVGDDSVVGACALVTKDVPPGVVVKGVPGRW